MIAVDTNVLVYAARKEMPLHRSALDELIGLAEGRAAWGLPLFCAIEFIRVVSHPRLFAPPTPAPEALGLIEALLESPTVRLLVPSDQFFVVLAELLADSGVGGNLVYDAQIAAVCREHGVTEILTNDRDFERHGWLNQRPLPDA